MSDEPVSLHAERTADPAVGRWVFGRGVVPGGELGARRVPPGSALAALVGRVVHGVTVHEVAVEVGGVTVRCDAPLSREVASRIDAAVREDAPRMAGWPIAAGATRHVPTVDEVQAVVDRAAGAAFTDHRGSMTVRAVSVDENGLRVQVEAGGACHGCRASGETVGALMLPALRRRYGDVDIVVG